jgi:hypothetical protein
VIVNVRAAAAAVACVVLLLVARLPSIAASSALTGMMSRYNVLTSGTWNCAAGGSTYVAEYALAPGNTLHGHLYSAHGSEDTYFGYTAATRRFWTVSADSNGATESQRSADGVTYTGTLSDGKTTSKATNRMTIVSSSRWTVHARGTADGQAYDLTATCERT